MQYDNTYFYDVESFPSFACVTFLEEGSEQLFQFKIGCGYREVNDLCKFVDRNILLVGFNNISYDDAVLRFIQNWNKRGNLPELIFKLSARLVSDFYRRDDDILALRYPRETFYSWNSLDLLKIMAFDKLGVSLKQVSVNLKHNKVQDLPFKYDYIISTQKEIQLVLDYNANDVQITKKLYNAIQPQIKLREEIGNLYDVDVRNASDSKMGNIILEHFYRTELGVDPRGLRDLRTKREMVRLGDCIPAVITFKSKELSALKERIENTTVYPANNFKFEQIVTFDGTTYSIGSGGIHSTEKTCRFDATEEQKIISCDIGSMYPSCIIINNIYPKHLGKDFVKVLSILTAERLSSKKTNKVKADALKITINGLYGKLNSDTFWLEDAEAMLRVTIAGQLYILMLVEMLWEKGIHCISANTDGIECLVSVEKEPVYYEVCKEWEKKTQFILEYAEYKSYIKRDINNYIAITTDGKVKTKGAFVPEVDLKKGYNHPIVQRAVNEYFIKGTPVEETIGNCRDPLDFCVSHKPGHQFQMEYHTIDGIQQIQRTNRFYVSNHGGTLQKRSKSKNTLTGLYVGEKVRLLNDYDESLPFEDFDIDVEWYIREAKSMIEEIEPTVVQQSLFDGLGVTDWGRKVPLVKKEELASISKPKPKKVSTKDILEANRTRTTFPISARYALVEDVNTKYSPVVKFYSLAKGTSQSFKISKNLFEKNPLKVGDVVHLSSFEERPKMKKEGKEFVEVPNEKVWWISSFYKVTDIQGILEKQL